MASNSISTMTEMIDALPESLQNKILEHLHEYVGKLQDKIDRRSQEVQEEIARKAQGEIEMLQVEIEMLQVEIEILQERSEMLKGMVEELKELQDELRWEASFDNTQEQLTAAAHRAKQEIAEGKAEPMDLDQL